MKKVLFRILGLKNYLKLLHMGFHTIYAAGGLKNNYIYKYHYFDKNIIREGDVVLDIGANLGYYTKLFAKWTGSKGHVYAVEPVTFFADTIKWGTKQFNNIDLYNVALGAEEKDVVLSTPGNFGYLRTGLAHISDKEEASSSEFSFTAKMMRPSKLFANLERIDFIKCDIEGYEYIVLPEMESVLVKHKPVIQLETWGEQKDKIEGFLIGIGYDIYELEDGKLKPISEVKSTLQSDLIFINKDNNGVIGRLKSKGLM